MTITADQHMLAVSAFAERGIAADGYVVEDAAGSWQLFVSAGPNVLREGAGSMFLHAQLYEVVVDEDDAVHEYDETTQVARARMQTTGEFGETIVTLANWLLDQGWRAEPDRLVACDPADRRR
jgi:hypothetical protein